MNRQRILFNAQRKGIVELKATLKGDKQPTEFKERRDKYGRYDEEPGMGVSAGKAAIVGGAAGTAGLYARSRFSGAVEPSAYKKGGYYGQDTVPRSKVGAHIERGTRFIKEDAANIGATIRERAGLAKKRVGSAAKGAMSEIRNVKTSELPKFGGQYPSAMQKVARDTKIGRKYLRTGLTGIRKALAGR